MSVNQLIVHPESSGPLFPTDRHLMPKIFDHLGIRDLIAQCFAVCKEWHECLNNKDFWKAFVGKVGIIDELQSVSKQLFGSSIPAWPYKREYEAPLATLMLKVRICPLNWEKRPDLGRIAYQNLNKNEDNFLQEECGLRVWGICKEEDETTALGKVRTIFEAGNIDHLELSVLKAAERGYFNSLIPELLKHGPIRDTARGAAVCVAQRYDNLEAVNLLLAGPIPDDSRGKSVVEAAEKGNFDIADAFLKNGSVTGSDALSAFKQAARNSDLRIAKLVAPHLPWKKIALAAVVIQAVGVSNVIKIGLGIKGLLHLLQPVFA